MLLYFLPINANECTQIEGVGYVTSIRHSGGNDLNKCVILDNSIVNESQNDY